MATERAEPRPYRFTVDEYLRLVAAGILTEDARTELIDGQIVVMPPADDPHVEAVTRCTEAFAALVVAGRARLSVQNPLRLGSRAAHDDPEPDLVLARPGGYGAPRPAEVLLLIEVADSSLAYDRRTKLPLYARLGIPEVWLLDLPDGRLEVYREPRPDGYAVSQPYRPGERLAPRALPDLEVAVADLLPPPPPT